MTWGGPDEPNETQQTAYDLREVRGQQTINDMSIYTPTDQDWYRFTLVGTGNDDNFARIDFDSSDGALGLDLVDAQGNTIRSSSDASDRQQVSLSGLAAGTYYLHVYGVNGAINPNYSLTINAPQTLTTDWAEPNNTAATAHDLRTLQGAATYTGLSIDAGDQDWFHFALARAGQADDFVQVDTQSIVGNIELALFNSATATSPVGTATGLSDHQQISLANLPAGDYWLKIYGATAATVNPDYSLLVNGPPAIVPDQYDISSRNNTQQTATPLGTVDGTKTLTNLSLDTASDQDWFTFQTGASSTASNSISISFGPSGGIATVAVYDAQLRLVGTATAAAVATPRGTITSASAGSLTPSSDSGQALTQVSLSGQPAGTYYVLVVAAAGTTVANYSLAIAAPKALAPDADENHTDAAGDQVANNDSWQTAYNLGALKGENDWSNLSIDHVGDVDFYRFQTAGIGVQGDQASISFPLGSGDLDLFLLDSNGNQINSSQTTGGSETIPLAGLPAGTYYLEVAGFNGSTNPNYTLSLIAPGAQPKGDPFEPNDTFNSATDLGPLQGGNEWTAPLYPLAIATGSDQDWFKFRLTQTGVSGDVAAIGFDDTQGDLDLELYDSQNHLLETSYTTANVEQVSLAGLGAGTYYLRVFGYKGAANSSYSLYINAPQSPFGEPNESQSAACPLHDIQGSWTAPQALSIEPGDQDWFQFSIVSQGLASDYVSIEFDHTLGDLDLNLFDRNGSLITSSQASADTQQVSLVGQPAGSYYLQIVGHSHDGKTDSNPFYTLTINAPQTALPDWAEKHADAAGDQLADDDTPDHAYDLGQVTGQKTWGDDPTRPLSIDAATDEDWYTFTTAATAVAGDFVSIAFDATLGDLDLQIYQKQADGNMKELGESSGIGDQQQISLANLAAGTYYVRVLGYNGQTNPQYALTINVPSKPLPDWAEGANGNNTWQTATTITTGARGQLVSELDNLSIDSVTDVDWFAFNTDGKLMPGCQVEILFDNSQGELDLDLYDANKKWLQTSASSTGNGEAVSLNGLFGAYYVKVYGHDSTTNPNYTLILLNGGLDWAEWQGADGVHTNNTRTNATDLRNVTGSRTWENLSIDEKGQADWFQFQLTATPDSSNNASITFNEQYGDLDFGLYRSNGTLIRASQTSNSTETVSLAGLSTNTTYYLEAFGHNSDVTNPLYTLSINAPSDIPADWAEPNNSQLTAKDLHLVDGFQYWSGLTSSAGDDDWFKFTISEPGVDGQFAGILFDHTQGQLELSLWDQNGTEITSSAADSNLQEVSLANLAAGTYYIKVLQKAGVDGLPYILAVNAALVLRPDWAEVHDGLSNNDSQSNAYDLRQVQGQLTLPSLSLDAATDKDWFKLELAAAGLADSKLRIDFNQAEGDMLIDLWDSENNDLDAAGKRLTLGDNYEEISLTGLPAGTYYVEVSGSGIPIPDYVLTVTAPQVPQPDDLPPNHTVETAYDLGDASQLTKAASNDTRSGLGYDQPGSNVLNGALGSLDLTTLGFTPSTALQAVQDFNITSSLNPILGGAPDVDSLINAYNDSQNSFLSPLGIVNSIVDPTQLLLQSESLTQQEQQLEQQKQQLQLLQQQQQQQEQERQRQQQQDNAILAVGLWLLFGPKQTKDITSLAAQPTGTLTHLSIDSPNAPDWFKFQLGGAGVSGQSVSIDYDHYPGDLYLELYDSSGNVLLDRSANRGEDHQEVSLAGLPAGTYYVKVGGVDITVNGQTTQATNPNYSLLFNLTPPPDPAGDWAEPNDNSPFSQATTGLPYDFAKLEGTQTYTGLSIRNSSDVDWFGFQTTTAGVVGDQVQINFNDAQGDLDLAVYDAQNNLVGQSTGIGDSEQVSLAGLPAGQYYFKVYGYEGASNPNYSITITGPELNVSPDRFEPNENASQAVDLNSLKGVSRLSNLTITPGDVDEFRFTTGVTGGVSDSLAVEFAQANGNLNLQLLDANGNAVSGFAAAATADGQQISLKGLPAGSYFIKVSAAAGVANHYDLAFNLPAETAQATADWTVMVYMTASNLAQYAEENINQMEEAAANLPGTVHFAVLLDQSSAGQTFSTPVAGGAPQAWGGTGEAIIQQDTDTSHVATTFTLLPSDLDTGDPASLTQFINWATANAPAQHYALVLWDHGNGVGGVNFDTLDGAAADHLTIPEVASAISSSQLEAAQGRKLDLLAFDACKMAMTEVDYDLKSVAGAIVASEETEGGAGYDYSTAFAALANQPNLVDGQTLAAGLVRSYQQEYQGDPGGADTESAVAAANVNALMAALQGFTTAMAGGSPQDWNLVRAARDAATSFHGSPDYRDLGQFMSAIADNSLVSATVRNAAQNVVTTLRNAITAKTSDARQTSGLAVYLPAPGAQLDADYVSQFSSFFAASGWSNFLSKFVSGASSTTISPDWAEANNSAVQAYNLHRLAGADHVYTGLNLDTAGDVDWFQFFIAAGGGTGDAVTMLPVGGQATLALYAGDDTTHPVLQSSLSAAAQSLSLAGQPAGEYYVRIVGDGAHALAGYTLRVDAPAAISAVSNDSQAKALDLGVIGTETVLNGLTLPGTDAWFTFRTPRTASLTPGVLHVDTQGQTLTSTLLNSQNQPLATATGSGDLQLNYPSQNEDGAEYFLHLTGGSTRSLTSQTAAINLDLAPATGSLAFSSGSFTANKGDGIATITVMRSGGSDGQVSVHYSTGGGSALAGSDYTGTSGDLTFPAGVTTAQFQMPINTNSNLDDDETVNLTLSNPQGGATLGNLAQAVLTIHSPTSDPAVVATGGLTISASQGVAFIAQTVATFTDPAGPEATSHYSVTIDWGDGTAPSAGLITFDSTHQLFVVSGSHSYAKSGNDPIHVTIHHEAAPDATASSTATITAEGTPHERYVTAVYEDVLGRGPDSGGLEYWTHLLDEGTEISSVAEAIAHSDEYYANFVIRPNYLRLLGRAADDGGVQHWTAEMRDNGLTDQELQANFVASDEFYKNAGGTDRAWVDAVYKLLLGRTADSDGEAYWTNQLAHSVSRQQVAIGIAGSQENNTQLINDDYYHYLGRAADTGGLDYWVGQFASGRTNEDVIAGFTGSAEYYKEHTD